MISESTGLTQGDIESGNGAIINDGKSNIRQFDAEERWKRIVMNDIENVLMGVVLHWLAFNAGGNNMVTAISMVIFTSCRFLYTICYILKLMPWRTVVWVLAVLSSTTASINIMYGVLG